MASVARSAPLLAQKTPATADIIAEMLKNCPDNLKGTRDRALLRPSGTWGVFQQVLPEPDRAERRKSGIIRTATIYRLCSPPRFWTVSAVWVETVSNLGGLSGVDRGRGSGRAEQSGIFRVATTY